MFGSDDGQIWLTTDFCESMNGPFLEHEEERGSLKLHLHPFTAAVETEGVTSTPFGQQWMTRGTETIFPLQPLAALAGS